MAADYSLIDSIICTIIYNLTYTITSFQRNYNPKHVAHVKYRKLTWSIKG